MGRRTLFARCGRAAESARKKAKASSCEGQKYLVYTRGYAGAHTLSLGAHRLNPNGVPGGTYTVRRFDPRTGEWTQLPELKGKGPFTIKPPDARDWAFMLVLKRAPREIKDNFEEKQ